MSSGLKTFAEESQITTPLQEEMNIEALNKVTVIIETIQIQEYASSKSIGEYSIIKKKSIGTGIIVDDRHVLTNYHNVKQRECTADRCSNTIKVKSSSIVFARFVKVIKFDERNDLALLEIVNVNPITIFKVKPIEFAQSLKLNDPIVIIGNPFIDGYMEVSKITHGTLDSIDLYGSKKVILVDAEVTYGNSGSGVIDSDGKLIGMIYAYTYSHETGEYLGALMITKETMQEFIQ